MVMVMLTQVLRFVVRDKAGHHAQVIDLAISLLEEDYPPVKHIYFQHNTETKRLDWDMVTELDIQGETIRVNDLSAAESVEQFDEVLLRRDILDSLILELLGRRTTRVCDILLDASNGYLRVRAADSGLAAMLRRILRNHLIGAHEDSMFDWKYVEFLRGDPDAVRNGAGYRLRINRLPAGEIARLADYIPYLHAAELLKLLPDEKAADVLEASTIERQLQIIEELDEEEARNLLCLMSPDLATDLIGRLAIPTMRLYLSKMPEDCRDRIVELLRFPEDSVGGAMTNDIIALPSHLDCASAQKSVRDALDNTHFSSMIFIVDDSEGRILRGAIVLHDLLAAADTNELDELMNPYLQTLSPFDDSTDAAYRIAGSQLPAMPVVNATGRLIGAMTMEAALAKLLPPTSGVQRLRIYS
jgi:magnesium transporter